MATIILKLLGQGGNLDSQFRGQVRQKKIPLPVFHTGSWEPRSRGYQVLVSEVTGSLNESGREANE